DMDYKLSQIFFTDELHGHAVAGGTQGDYFRTEDGGETWTMIAGNFKGGTSGRIYDMMFVNDSVGYAAGYYGHVYKTSNGGQTFWDQIETPEHFVTTNTYLPAIYVLNENEFWVGGKDGRLYFSDDGGASFVTYELDSGDSFDSFWFTSWNQGLVMAGSVIYQASPGSVVFTPTTKWVATSWQAGAVVDGDKLCLAALKGMYSYGDPDDLPLPRLAMLGNYPNLKNVYFKNGMGFLLGYKSVMMTQDDGASWVEILNADSGLSKYAQDMAFIDENTGYIGDSGGTLWKTTDGGFTWKEVDKVGTGLYRVIFKDENTGYLLDYKEQQILKTTQGDTSWQPISVTDLSKCYLYDMEFVDDSTLVIAGYDATTSGDIKGLIVKSSDYGETWSTVFHDKLSYSGLNLFSLEFYGQTGYATGNNGVILKTEDGGDSWTEDVNPITGEVVYLYGSKFMPNGDYYAFGSMGYILKMPHRESSVNVAEHSPIKDFSLHHNYPNPFNPSTTISYELPGRSAVKLTVFNAMGQQIAILVDSNKDAGSYQINWEAANMPSGIYFYRLEAEGFSQTKKMLLLK
ncbi:MAG: YCF48-related protein, partial [bacterium]|nr:YCF48-related protein [bacterium]